MSKVLEEKEQMDDEAEKKIASVIDRTRAIEDLYQRCRREGTTTALTKAVREADTPLILSGSKENGKRIALRANKQKAKVISWSNAIPSKIKGVVGEVIPDNYFMERFLSSIRSTMKFLIGEVRRLRDQNRNLRKGNKNLKQAFKESQKKLENERKKRKEAAKRLQSIQEKVNSLRDGND